MSKSKKKKVSGPLTLVEKAAIQGFLGQGQETPEIAESLNRSERLVDKYISGELDNLHSTIVNARMQAAESDSSVELNLNDDQADDAKRYSKASTDDVFKIQDAEKGVLEEVSNQETVDLVMKRLVQAGLKDSDATKVLAGALERFYQAGRKFKDENELYTECIRQMKAGEFMIKRSQGGREGVAIMTPAASQRMDKQAKPTTSRIARNNIFRPNG
ncbi:hypothetical protein DRO61_01880 [Candidatus Bathyarchaeota archaeon]|nr:MAG: hypothetical protein DRO61_01880 [Candidatus Bathyarchaeota archaeon]